MSFENTNYRFAWCSCTEIFKLTEKVNAIRGTSLFHVSVQYASFQTCFVHMHVNNVHLKQGDLKPVCSLSFLSAALKPVGLVRMISSQHNICSCSI